MKPSAEYFRQVLHYDRLTGVFTWKHRDGIHRSWNTKYAGKVAGSVDADGYWIIRLDSRTYKAHRVAWVYENGGDIHEDVEIDHRNGDRMNNSISNLRVANDAQNAANAKVRIDNKSGAKGVSWHRRIGKWQAQINECGKRRSLGYYDTVEQASSAYRERARALHGDFARL